jgi:RNA polymerase sigma factor (sigma-70 family)
MTPSQAAEGRMAGACFERQPHRSEKADSETFWAPGKRAASLRTSVAASRGLRLAVDREDLLQEGLIACWRASSRYDPNRASVATFFDRVAANRIASVLRVARRHAADPLDEASAGSVSSDRARIELRLDVARAIRTLNADDRRLAVALMEHSPAETSSRLGLARSTMYTRIARLRKHFIAAGISADHFLERRTRA